MGIRGRGNLTLNADTQKLGLWPGGFFMVEVEGNFGNDVNLHTGASMPVNSNQLYPCERRPAEHPRGDVHQFLSPEIGLILGKLDITSGT